jgi:hypothetical protein
MNMDKRQAKQLAQALEAIENGEEIAHDYLSHPPEGEPDFSALFEVVDLYKDYPTPAPGKRFRYAARSRILTSLKDQEPVTFSDRIRHKLQTTSQTYTRRPVMSIILIVTLLLSLVGGATSYASQGSLPGDLLHPLKLAIEDFRLSMTPEEGETDLHLQFANERVEEVKELVDKEEYDQIGVTMRRFVSQAATVRQNLPETGQDVDDPLGVHIEVLSGLVKLDQVPEKAKEAIEHAIEMSRKYQLPEENGKPVEVPLDLPSTMPENIPAVVPENLPSELPAGNPPEPMVPPVEPFVPPVENDVQPVDPVVPPVEPVVPPVETDVPVDPPVQPPTGRP